MNSHYDAVGLAELVHRREINAAELAQTGLAAIEAVNPKINAVVETFPERAVRATGSGPLGACRSCGKDVLIQEEGRLTAFGSRLAAGPRMPYASKLALWAKPRRRQSKRRCKPCCASPGFPLQSSSQSI
ncbi:MAG: hypothetical protein ACREYF_08330 [Gammaproteobacteria bacterium]